jgi:glucose/arabinose dehydrogenase
VTDTGKVFIDISQGLFTGQDSGLINMVFHPQYGQAASPNRNYFYLYYVADLGGSQAVRVSRFTATDGQNAANKSTEQIMIQEPLPDTYHRGGGMTFGKDGFLYVSFGEYGNPNNGQLQIISRPVSSASTSTKTRRRVTRCYQEEPGLNQNLLHSQRQSLRGQAAFSRSTTRSGERNPTSSPWIQQRGGCSLATSGKN